MEYVTTEDHLRLDALAAMYQLAVEIAAGDYPMDTEWAEKWIADLPVDLRAKLDSLPRP